MLPKFRSLSLGAFVLFLFVSSGCGGAKKGAILKGTVVLPSNVKLGESDSATVNFSPGSDGGKQFSATINPADLTFVAGGAKGNSVLPGKYKITVLFQPYVRVESQQKAAFDALNARYDEGKSNLSYTVTEDSEQAITIDLDKGTVTKK